MKKSLLYLCALIGSMSLFTACNNDDKEVFPVDEELVGVYKGAMDIVNMIWDRCADAIEGKEYEDAKMEILRVFSMDIPYTEEESRNTKTEQLVDRTFDAAMATFKRRTERMSLVADPVIRKVYEEQGNRFENILIPITDGKRMYNITCNLKKSYENGSKEVVNAYEKLSKSTRK